MLIETSLIETEAVAFIDHRKLVEAITAGLEVPPFTNFMDWAFNLYGEQYHIETGMLLVEAVAFLERYDEYFAEDEYDDTEGELEAITNRIREHIRLFLGDINILNNTGITVYIKF